MARKNVSSYEAHKILSARKDTKQQKKISFQEENKEDRRSDNRIPVPWEREERRQQELSWAEVTARRQEEPKRNRNVNEKAQQPKITSYYDRINRNAINEYYNKNFNNREEEITKNRRGIIINNNREDEINRKPRKTIQGIVEHMSIIEEKCRKIQETMDNQLKKHKRQMEIIIELLSNRERKNKRVENTSVVKKGYVPMYAEDEDESDTY